MREEHIRNQCVRRRGVWQVPIFLVQVAESQHLYTVKGWRLTIGKPIYPTTKIILSFNWEPQGKDFPWLLNVFDNGDVPRLLGMESMLTSFAYKKHRRCYLDAPPGPITDYLHSLKPQWGMEEFGKFYNYHTHIQRTQRQQLSPLEFIWKEQLLYAANLYLLASAEHWGRNTSSSARDNRQNLVSLTSQCLRKVSHWFERTPSSPSLSLPYALAANQNGG